MSGSVTASDFREFFAASQIDMGLIQGADRLIIVTEVSGFPTGEEIRGIAARLRAREGNSPARFAVVTRDSLATGVANMMFRMAGLSDDRYRMFDHREEAEVWLWGRGEVNQP